MQIIIKIFHVPEDAISSKSFGAAVGDKSRVIFPDKFVAVIDEQIGICDQRGLDTAASTTP